MWMHDFRCFFTLLFPLWGRLHEVALMKGFPLSSGMHPPARLMNFRLHAVFTVLVVLDFHPLDGLFQNPMFFLGL